MLNWIPVSESKPEQGKRVLLKIRLEECPVVGYWGHARWEACTVNFKVSCGSYCYGGSAIEDFRQEDVTHYAEIGELPDE